MWIPRSWLLTRTTRPIVKGVKFVPKYRIGDVAEVNEIGNPQGARRFVMIVGIDDEPVDTEDTTAFYLCNLTGGQQAWFWENELLSLEDADG